MNKTIFSFFILTALSCLFSTIVGAQHVFYGERTDDTSKTALYFDKDGFLYPDYFIPDSSMIKADGSLFTWFLQNNEAFISIAAHYQLFPESIDKTTIFRLRDSITAQKIRSINQRSGNFPAVAFYIHGFRKLYTTTGNEVTSVDEFRFLEKNLADFETPKALEVEVYWDGLYDCCFSMNHRKNKQLFQLYEIACKNACTVGIGLRSVLSEIKNDRIQLLSHSLGAAVVTSALFNRDECLIATPGQKNIRMCLIAPAIDGRKTFQSYYNRTANCDRTSADNYHLMIVYNEADFVLRKKDPKTGLFGPGTKRYGATSLGCNHRREAVKLKQYFEKHYPQSEIILVDKTSLGKRHSFRYYAAKEELKEVSDFLWK